MTRKKTSTARPLLPREQFLGKAGSAPTAATDTTWQKWSTGTQSATCPLHSTLPVASISISLNICRPFSPDIVVVVAIGALQTSTGYGAAGGRVLAPGNLRPSPFSVFAPLTITAFVAAQDFRCSKTSAVSTRICSATSGALTPHEKRH
jgi:hypothetical protein